MVDSEKGQVAIDQGEEPISQLKLGDHVLAYDQSQNVTGYYTVTAILVNYDSAIEQLTIEGETLTTTPEHPFFTQEQGWVAAGELQTGQHIRRADGSYGVVEAVGIERRPQTMYNLTVAQAHTFFVGQEHWLVHNVCKKPGGYETFDIDTHRNLSPGANRAQGYQNTRSDSFIQSHHIVQNEWAEANNIAGYSKWDAPAILIPTGTLPNGQRLEHTAISTAQSAARDARIAQGLPKWGTSLQEELRFSYRNLTVAGVSADIAQRALREAYKYFSGLGVI